MKRRALTKNICLGIREALGLYGCELDACAENYDNIEELRARHDAVWKWVSYAEARLEERALKRKDARN